MLLFDATRTLLTLYESVFIAITYQKVSVGFFAGITKQADVRVCISDIVMFPRNDSGTEHQVSLWLCL